MALRAPLMRHQHDEEKGQPDVHLSPQEYAKMEIPYETDNRTSLGEFYKLTDEQLKETIKYRIEQMRKGGSELEEDESKSFLVSTHYILFKITDYMSIPSLRFECSCMGIADLFVSLLFGCRQRNEKGVYDPLDQSRFLLLFHDVSCFYLVGCSLFVFIAQYMSITSILNSVWSKVTQCSDELDDDCSPYKLCHDDEGASNFSVLLCILYAASQALEDLLICIPFEIVGVSREEYCFWVHQKISHGKRPRPTYWWKTISGVLRTGNPYDKQQDIKNFIELCFAVIPSLLLILSNLYLVMCIAFIMATSSTTLDLVQNFIAVEILVQAHTMIAKLMRIRDRSPDRFSKHWRLTLHELEKVKALPIYLKNKDGTDGLRARLTYQRFNNIVFTFYSLLIYGTYCVVLVYICKDESVLT